MKTVAAFAVAAVLGAAALTAPAPAAAQVVHFSFGSSWGGGGFGHHPGWGRPVYVAPGYGGWGHRQVWHGGHGWGHHRGWHGGGPVYVRPRSFYAGRGGRRATSIAARCAAP